MNIVDRILLRLGGGIMIGFLFAIATNLKNICHLLQKMLENM